MPVTLVVIAADMNGATPVALVTLVLVVPFVFVVAIEFTGVVVRIVGVVAGAVARFAILGLGYLVFTVVSRSGVR